LVTVITTKAPVMPPKLVDWVRFLVRNSKDLLQPF